MKERLLERIQSIASRAQNFILLAAFLSLFCSAAMLAEVQLPSTVEPLQPLTAKSSSFSVLSGGESASQIRASITGAVKNPGVYAFTNGAVINDLLAKAGGLDAKADKLLVSKNINLAKKLVDGEQIYIAFIGEQNLADLLAKDSQTKPAGSTDGKLININTASVDELDTLPGVGAAIAAKIVTARPFKTLADLQSVSGISENLFSKIKDLITI